MGLFDKIKSQAAGAVGNAVGQAARNGSNKSVEVVFSSMPEVLAEFTALPQAAMQTPFDTAALVVAALCVYPLSANECVSMLNYLRGPNPLSPHDLSFLNTRMAQNNKAGFIGASYLNGATPKNDYTPTEPYTLTVSENPYSYDTPGYAKMFVKSGGGDAPRFINLRQAKDGKWYLWEHFPLLGDIREPESANPWA